MMKRKEQTLFLFLVYVVISVFFLSCKGDPVVNTLLQEAGAVMDNRPDSAYTILLHADSIGGFNRAQRAEWNLLITQAKDKAYMEHTTDSLIREAMAYYEKKKDSRKLMLSYYTMGRVSQELGDALQAQRYYLKARDVIEKDSSYYARIRHHMSYLYLYQDLPEKALPYLMELDHYYAAQNDSVDIRSVSRDLGRTYSTLHKPDSALFYYKKALNYSPHNQKIGLLNEIIHLYINQKELDTAFIYIQEIQQFPTDSLPSQSHLVLGQYFVQTNQPDSARYYLMKGLDSDNIYTYTAVCHHLYLIARERQDLKNFTLYQTKYEVLRDSIMKNTHAEKLQQLETLYNHEKKDADLMRVELAHIKAKQNMMWFIFLIFALLLLALYFYRQSISNKRQLREQQMRWDLLMEELEKNKQNQENLDKIKKLINAPIYQRFKDPENKIVTFEEKEEFIKLVNEIYPRFRNSLHLLYLPIDDNELFLCYLCRCDIPPKSIAIIMEKSESNIANKRAALGVKLFGENCGAKIFNQKLKQLN